MPLTRPGTLRIYLGSCAGIGKTYAMLGDARVAHEDGADIVIGYLEAHGRQRTEDQAADLERAPLIDVTGRRAELGVDVDWLIDRRPSIAVVDEFAHTNAAGSRHTKRYEDIDDVLAAGIDVWTTVNIQHLESLNDRVEQLTGVRVVETFPDRYLQQAAEIRLIDLSPSALRERIQQGLVYAVDRIEGALTGFFSVRNLTALRALALHEMAETAAAQLAEIDEAAEARPNERILVAVGGNPETAERLVRTGSRLARRSQGQLLVIFVKPSTGSESDTTREAILRIRGLTESLNGVFLQRVSDEPAQEIVEEANAQAATQIVLGATLRSRFRALMSPSPIDAVMRQAHGVDLHIVAHPTSDDNEEEG